MLLAMDRVVYWYGITADIRSFVHTCKICQAVKGDKPSSQGLQQLFGVARFNDIVHMAITGPYPRDIAGYKYVISIIDHHTRVLVLVPIKSVGMAHGSHAVSHKVFH